jgi:hypothetical protein
VRPDHAWRAGAGIHGGALRETGTIVGAPIIQTPTFGAAARCVASAPREREFFRNGTE